MVDLLLGLLNVSASRNETLLSQLIGQLRAAITSGRLTPGQRFPSSRHLARSLKVSRNTVSVAIEQLAAEGYLSTAPGRRPVVTAGLSLAASNLHQRKSEQGPFQYSVSPWARG